MKNNKRNPNLIIVHHSLSAWGSGEVIKRWHCDPKPRGNGWKNPGYHVVICNGYTDYSSWSGRKYNAARDGRVDRILSEDQVANGCKGANAHSLHVCLIGNFDRGFDYLCTGLEQWSKLIDLCVYWCKEYNLSVRQVMGHGEVMKEQGNKFVKTCPGAFFHMDILREEIATILFENEVSR